MLKPFLFCNWIEIITHKISISDVRQQMNYIRIATITKTEETIK